jgi:hypothetical protein
LVESTYHISEQNYNLEITQTDDSSHLEPLIPLDTFAEFYFSKLTNETRSFLKGEYRHFLELLKTLQKVISEVPDVVPYFTHDNIFLDKDGHLKIISAKFYKKDDHSVKESKEKIQEVIEFIENTMLPLLRTV